MPWRESLVRQQPAHGAFQSTERPRCRTLGLVGVRRPILPLHSTLTASVAAHSFYTVRQVLKSTSLPEIDLHVSVKSDMIVESTGTHFPREFAMLKAFCDYRGKEVMAIWYSVAQEHRSVAMKAIVIDCFRLSGVGDRLEEKNQVRGELGRCYARGRWLRSGMGKKVFARQEKKFGQVARKRFGSLSPSLTF